MESKKKSVSLVLVLTVLGHIAAAIPAGNSKDGDIPLSDEGSEDEKGRTFGLLKKPIFFQGYDSIVETGLDSIGSLLGAPGSFGNFLSSMTRLKPLSPARPLRPLRPLRPFRPYKPYRPYKPKRPSKPIAIVYRPEEIYANEYGYSPFYDDGYFYNDFRDDVESKDIIDAELID